LFVPASAIVCQLLLIRVLPDHDANSFFVMLSTSMVASVFSDFGQRNTIYTDVSGLRGGQLIAYVHHVYRARLINGLTVGTVAAAFAMLLASHSLTVAILFGVITANLYQADPGTKLLCGKAMGSREIPLSLLDRGLVIVGLSGMFWLGIQSLVFALAIYVVAGCLRLWASVVSVEAHILQSERKRAKMEAEPDINGDQHIASLGKNHFWAGLLLLLTMVNMRLPVLILPAFDWQEYAAHFGILLAVCQSFVLLPTLVTRVLFPRSLFRDQDRAATSLLSNRVLLPGVGLCLSCGLLASAMLYAFAAPLLSLLHPDYATRPELLKLVSLTVPLICAIQFVRLLLTSTGRAKALLLPIATGTVLGFTAMMLLGLSQGPRGILFGYLIAELTAVILGISVARKQIRMAATK